MFLSMNYNIVSHITDRACDITRPECNVQGPILLTQIIFNANIDIIN